MTGLKADRVRHIGCGGVLIYHPSREVDDADGTRTEPAFLLCSECGERNPPRTSRAVSLEVDGE